MRVLLASSCSEQSGMTAVIDRIALERNRAAVVTTASVEHKERNRNAIAARAAIESAGFGQVAYIDFDHDKPEVLRSFDLICLSGGNPHYLLMRILDSQADDVLCNLAEQGTPIVGVSAGGLVLSPSTAVVDIFDPNLSDHGFARRQGLSIVPFVVLPHSNRWRTNLGDVYHEKLRAARLASDVEVRELPDGQFIVFDGEEGEEVSV